MWCHKKLERHNEEKIHRYLKRKYCSKQCSGWRAASERHKQDNITPWGSWNHLDEVDDDIIR